ncbi:M10 family metallopeptidase C-terminal domain-containing protein [Leptolyngbya ohadii]|uniref:M10 family metallopeptidase C-terminal domain-containing protein n=1 Tax=Leptolyngbya ohadii TaxID=1962290 RepID=UPI000B599452|nr:M10 family metallopeptidase C-terminal domain-containing protein [Leptolyngbya ohadii]
MQNAVNLNFLQGTLSPDDLLYPSFDDLYYYDDVALTDLSTRQSITISLEAQQFTPYLELRQANDLRQVLSAQEGQGAAQLTFTPKPGVDYVLRITSATANGLGDYRLTTSAGGLNPVPLYQAEALAQQGQYRWQPDRPSGKPTTLTYGFMEELPSYRKPNRKGQWDGGSVGDFKPMTEAQRKAVKLALQAWEDVSGITFKEARDRTSAQIRFGTARDLKDKDTLGWAYSPDRGDPPRRRDGEVWLNHQESSNRRPKPGSYGFSTILHEIGHAIGLSHPFDDGATLPLTQQTIQYTVMAYDNHPFLPKRYQPSAPMLYDIAAIQQLYGRNRRTGSGNTTYRWKPGETFIETIYDVGGNDTVNARNQKRDTFIDLQPGRFSSIGAFGSNPIWDNVTIAFGITIENAIGGAGNDFIAGNSANNQLIGSAGSDVLIGLGGNDKLTGGAGADYFVFQTEQDGVDTITDYGLGSDTIDVARLLAQVDYKGTDPFAEGFLSASVQRGNTVISFDRDGFGGTAPATPLVILENFTNLQGLNLTTQYVMPQVMP